jgi:hypothetical protein
VSRVVILQLAPCRLYVMDVFQIFRTVNRQWPRSKRLCPVTAPAPRGTKQLFFSNLRLQVPLSLFTHSLFVFGVMRLYKAIGKIVVETLI